MPKILWLIPLFEILGLMGFIYLATLLSGQEIRYLPLVLAAGFVIWLAVKNGKELTSKQIVVASISVSLIFVGCFQLLGFLFPGLSKDVDLLSFSNLVRLCVIGIVATVGHAGLFVAVRYFHR